MSQSGDPSVNLPPDRKLEIARRALPSPSGAPGMCMSRRELAEAANAYVWEHTSGQQRTNMTEHDIGRYERGEVRWPSRWRRFGLRGVLGAGSDSELGFYPNRRSTNGPPRIVGGGSASAVAAPFGLGGSESGSLLTLKGSVGQPFIALHEAWDAATGTGDQLASLDMLSIQKPTPTSIGWADVDHVRFVTHMFALSENMYGGGFSAEVAAAQLRYAASLVDARATEDVRRAMLEAVGNLGEVVGYSAFDVQDYESAYRCLGFSLWCAGRAKSWSLRASALSDMARIATYLGKIDEALTLMEMAQVRADRLPATARAMLCAVRARLLALHGRYAEARAEVDRSDSYMAERNASEDPPWLGYYDQAEHEGSTGRALIPGAVATKEPEPAARRLRRAIRLHDKHHPRSREFSRTRLASLLMKVGDVSEAVSVARMVLAQSVSMRSSRLSSEIRRFGEVAAAHDRIPAVAELRTEVQTLTASDRV